MQRDRPTAVLVMAILNFLFGAMGLCGALCLVIGVVGIYAGASAAPANGEPNVLKEMAEVYKSIPGYVPYMIISATMGLIATVTLIIAGIGLLKMRPWARWACVIYGVYTVLASLGGLVYTLTVVNPALSKWQEEAARRHPSANTGNSGMNDAMSVGGAVLGMAYGIALLIVMFLPHVSAAFAGTWHKPAPPEEDYYDDDFRGEERERRPPEGGDDYGIRPKDDL